MQTCSESAAGVQITRGRAIVELQRHGHALPDMPDDWLESLASFDADFGGGREFYQAAEVLAWLGY